MEQKETIIVIGAGMAGIAAAKQLQSFGYKVIVLEARDRPGGRVHTDSSLGGEIDLGASIITGLEGNPLTVLCKQLFIKLHPLHYECPIFDIDGKLIEKSTDEKVEQEFNRVLDESSKRRDSLPPSLGQALRTIWDAKSASPLEQRLFNWHIANLEYACAADLEYVSLQHWDQDDGHEWAGVHCLLREGYFSIIKPLCKDLDIRYNTIVHSVEYSENHVKVHTQNGIFEGDVALVTLPLGVLKEGYIT